MGRPRHVKAPCAVSGVVGDPTRLLRMSLQTPGPVVDCQPIVLPQALDIPHFKAAQFCRSKARANWYQFTVGKHVVISKRGSTPAIRCRIDNSVVQEYTARPQ
jgi:hypothetical protein